MYREEGELTPRQWQVMELLALGISTREMADRLFVSVKTVESHMHNLKVLLGVATIRQLTVLAVCRCCPQGAYELTEKAPDGTTVKYQIKKIEARPQHG